MFLQKLIWLPTRLILTAFYNLKIKGLENLEGIKCPIIFACNHVSELDPFLIPASLPFFSRFSPMFYIVREKDFYKDNGWRRHFFDPWFINMWGGYTAVVGLHDYSKSLAKHVAILKNGGSFCIFPEGRIARNGEILPAKGGISFLAHSAPCTVIPVGISGISVKKITVNFGQPIILPGLPWKEEAELIMKKVGELI